MKFRIFLLMAALVCVFATAASAADIDGKWIAQMPSRGGEAREVTFTFRAEGNTLTGSMSTPRGEQQISDGKINGDEISFAMVYERQGNQMKMLYKGTVSGNEIKFTTQREGSDRTREFTAKKAAS
jgi:opacity protein-like surface antigen